MNAQQLVELRKQGSISQEEFFVGLNSLRRQNSEAHQRAGGSSRDEAKAAAVVDADADADNGGNDADRVEEEDCGDDDGRSEIDAAAGPAEASSETVSAARASAEEPPLPAEDRQEGAPSKESEIRRDGAAFVGDHAPPPPPPPPPAEGLLLSGEVQQQLREELSDPGAVSAELPRLELVSRSMSPRSKPRPRLSTDDADDVVQDNRPQTPPRVRCWADGAGGNPGAGAGRDEDDGDCDSGWLVSPSGESRQRSTSSRPRRSRATDNTEGKLRGARTSLASERLSPRGDDGPQTAKPDWRPVGRRSGLVPPWERPNDGRFLRSKPATPPRAHGGGISPEDGSNKGGGGDGGEGRLGAELSPRRGGEGGAATPGADCMKTRGVIAQPDQHNGGGMMSGRHSSSTAVSPLRPGSRGAGPLEGDEAIGAVSQGLRRGASPRRCGEGRAAFSRVARSPAKPGWRPAGGPLAQPSSNRSGGVCRGGVLSQPATRSLSSSRSTASDPTLATVDDVIVGRRAEGGNHGGDGHARRHRGVQGRFDGGPGRAPPPPPPPPLDQQQEQLRPEGCEQPPAGATATAAAEQEAPAPAIAPASAMARWGGSPMVPYTSRRRRRANLTAVAAAGSQGGGRPPENGGRGVVDPGHHHHRGRGSDLTRSGGDRAPLSDSAGILRQSRDRHRESLSSTAGRPRRDSRRRSSNISAASFDSGRYYTTAVRCDRFGYPLHERECLGSSGPSGGGGGGGGGGATRAGVGPVFSPTIKGLPDFYESRPRRTGGARYTDAEKQSSVSLYTRTTDWQARASELRYDFRLEAGFFAVPLLKSACRAPPGSEHKRITSTLSRRRMIAVVVAPTRVFFERPKYILLEVYFL